jgi:nitrous oxide reductase
LVVDLASLKEEEGMKPHHDPRFRVDRRTMFKGAAAAFDGEEVANARGLTPEDVEAALKTYVPSGKYDEYYIFASGGHSGQVLVIGVPSMRLLKVIGVFTPNRGRATGSPTIRRPSSPAATSTANR